MNPEEARELLTTHAAMRSGHFRLSSGRHSDTYVQCAQVLQSPEAAERIGRALATTVSGSGATVVLGPAMGGVLVAHEVARALGVRMVFSERVDGEMTLRRGFVLIPEDRVVVAEDVVSTGRSQGEAIALVKAAGATLVGVVSIVDRSSGVTFDAPLHSLVTVTAPQWEATECPLCAEGHALDSPGSRYLVGG